MEIVKFKNGSFGVRKKCGPFGLFGYVFSCRHPELGYWFAGTPGFRSNIEMSQAHAEYVLKFYQDKLHKQKPDMGRTLDEIYER